MSDQGDSKEPSVSGTVDQSANEQSDEKMMNIIVKTSKERESFQIATDANVKQLRELVSDRYKVDQSKICLIFSGKILKDGDTLEGHKMKDGQIVHLVIRDASKPPATASITTASSASSTTQSNPPTSTPFSGSANTNTSSNSSIPSMFSQFNTLFGQNNNAAPSSLDDMNQQFAQQMNNPEFIRQMLDNPLMQNIYSNPDIFRSIISNNPQFQQLIERNPELNHVLSNPEILRQTFEMMRNPSTFQELMRSHDRALSNLESLPGGYNALRRMYTELQEPMLNAAQEQFVGNPFATSNTASPTTTTTPSNTENREPLPNPWDRSSNASNNNNTPQPPVGGATNPPSGGANRNSPFSLFNPNAMQGFMQQFSENPGLLQNILNSPMMQNMVQSLSNDPQLASQLMSQTLAGGAPNNATIQSAISSMSQSIQNPLFQRILTNPQALQALMQIQQGYDQLERALGERPENLFELLNQMGNSSVAAASTASTTSSSTTTTASPTSLPQTTPSFPVIPNPSVGASPTSTTTPSGTPNLNAASLTQMMQQMFNVSQQQQQQQQHPELRYQAQLTQLEQMGFTNREANLRALAETFGNVEAAIDRLLSRM